MLKIKNYILLNSILISFLFITNCFSQKELIDKLKMVELNFATSTFDTVISQNKSNLYQSISLELNAKIDNITQFISNQKRNSEASFDATIQPFLMEQLAEINNQSIDFNEQEVLIFESFTKQLQWNSTWQRLKVYENFIDENFKNKEQVKNLIYVISAICFLHFYIENRQEKQVLKSSLICLKQNFEDYNAVNWKVFALNPTAILLWTLATCIWETTFQNQVKKQ